MTIAQGSLALLNEPLAQTLLQSTLPARLAYNWPDGSPRVIPIGFHWHGRHIVVCSPPDAPKMKALKNGVKVALTIDNDRPRLHVLLIRGTVQTDIVAGLPPEYVASVERAGKEQAQSWLDMARSMFPSMARIFIEPEWVGLIDFATR